MTVCMVPEPVRRLSGASGEVVATYCAMAGSDIREPTRANFGIDAPYVPSVLAAMGGVCVVAGVLVSATWLWIVGAFFLAQTLVYLHATLRGKFRAWDRLLDDLHLAGDEQVLDIGCGRGAVLLAAARRLPRGRATGIDLWRSADQSGNDEAVTASNAHRAGLDERVELRTGDMLSLPFDDAAFDVVVSSLAIHNLPVGDRLKALDEAVRVLRPQGRLVVADIRTVKRYAEHLREMGAVDVAVRGLGPGFWFAGPWQATTVVSARKA
jgi:arsenite methyltransferase